MAIEAELADRFSQLRVILGSMHIVATEARNPVPIHHALHKIVSLHTVLVRCAVREMSERRLPQRVFFELPEIPQIESDTIAYRPIVVLALDRIGQRAPL